MKKIIAYVFVFVFVAGFVSAICEDFNPSDFSSSTYDSGVIDCAINYGLEVTSEQFSLASILYKHKHVLSQRADFFDVEQRKTFQSAVLGMNFNAEEHEKQIASYFAWLHDNLGEEVSWEDRDTLAFERIISVHIGLINKPVSEFTSGYSSYAGPKHLFIFYANMTKNVTFVKVDGQFELFDMEKKIFATSGVRARNFSLDTIVSLKRLGFSDFVVYSDGRVGALKYKNDSICDDCETVITNEGVLIEGRNIRLNNGYVLNDGAIMVHSDSRITIYEGSVVTDVNGAVFSPSKNTLIARMDSCPRNYANTCVEIYEDESMGYVGVNARADNFLRINDRAGAYQFFDVSQINDNSEIILQDSAGDKAFIDASNFMVRGDPNFIVGFGNDECSGFWGSVSGTCSFGIDRVGDTVVDRAIGIKDRHDDFITRFGTGTHYGSNSSYPGMIINHRLTPKQAWVADALYRGAIRGFGSFGAAANKVKALSNSGFNDEQLLNYYFFRRDGLNDEDAIQKARTTNLDSRLLDDVPDMRLTQTDCVTFVDEVLQLSFEEWKKADIYKDIKRDALNSDPNKQLSVYWIVHHLKVQRNWQTIFLSPQGKDRILLSNKDGKTVYWGRTEVDYIATNYYSNGNSDYDYLENNALLRAGVVSFGDAYSNEKAVGYHAGLMIRDPSDGKLKIIEQSWGADTRSKRSFTITPLVEYTSHDHMFISVIPGSLR